LDDVRSWTSRYLEDFPSYNFVYEVDGKIAGAISGIIKEKDVGLINDIAVEMNYRNQKIGTHLLEHLLHEFKKAGLQKVQLAVNWKNAGVIPFHYRHGFVMKEVGILDDEEVVYLEKKLND
jgi:ribosomal-protein-alanine N-acetyltransferase